MALNTLPFLVFSAKIFAFGGMALGVYLILWAANTFRTHQTAILPHRTPDALITSGPFQWNRNPIYTGMILITLSVGVSQGSLLGAVPAFVLYWALDTYFAGPEEQRLRDTFGEAAEDYIKSIRRW